MFQMIPGDVRFVGFRPRGLLVRLNLHFWSIFFCQAQADAVAEKLKEVHAMQSCSDYYCNFRRCFLADLIGLGV